MVARFDLCSDLEDVGVSLHITAELHAECAPLVHCFRGHLLTRRKERRGGLAVSTLDGRS